MFILIGIDIENQGTKAVLINTNGNIYNTSYQEYKVETIQPSWIQQCPEIWAETLYNFMKELIVKSNVNNKEHIYRAIMESIAYALG